MLPERSAWIIGGSVIVGCVALGLLLRLASGGTETGASGIGRYQLGGVPGHMFVLDTATGRVWEKWAQEGGFNNGPFTRVTLPPPNPADPLLNDLSDVEDVRKFIETKKNIEAPEKRSK